MAVSEHSYRRKKTGFFLKSEWKVFFWCLITSFFLWYLTALNETYSSYLDLRVHYSNVPQNRVFVNPLPEKIRAAVLAKGWDLLAYRLGGKHEDVSIDLSDYQKQNYILTRNIKVAIQQQLPPKITLNELYPDTISLAAARSMRKKLPVNLKLDIHFKPQFGLGGEIAYQPDSVYVNGPENIVSQMKEVSTQPLKLKDLDEPVKTQIALKKPLRTNIAYSTGQIKVEIPVYQLTEGNVNIPIEVVNPEIQGIKLIPSSVKIKYQTSLNLFKSITPDMFEAIADVSNIDSSRQIPIKVQLISKPKNVYNIKLDPEYINYIISK